MTSMALRGCIVLVATLLGGCLSSDWIARHQFAGRYSCPSDQIKSRTAAALPSGGTPIDVTGCGYDAEYYCRFGGSDDNAGEQCTERLKIGFVATDGSISQVWGDFDSLLGEVEAAAKEAAVASAARDLPCQRASISVVGKDSHGYANILEGCGQRITYQIVEHDLARPPGRVQQVWGRRYMLVGRIPIPAP